MGRREFHNKIFDCYVGDNFTSKDLLCYIGGNFISEDEGRYAGVTGIHVVEACSQCHSIDLP